MWSRVSRLRPLLAGMLLLSPASGGAATSQPSSLRLDDMGAYRFADGGVVTICLVDGHPFAALPLPGGGEGRGLFATVDGFDYGPSFLVREPVEGHLRFAYEEAGPVLLWRHNGQDERRAAHLPIRLEDVSFLNSKARLAGTVYLPVEAGPHPAVILLHGSGEETRDRSFLPYYLAQHGLVVLTYDKRGCGGSKARSWKASFEEYADDALAGLRLLAARSDVRADRIGVLGHSQGGWVAPLVAARGRTGEVAFVILESANAVPPVEQELFRGRRLLEMKTHLLPAEIEQSVAFRRQKFEVAISGVETPGFRAALEAARQQRWLDNVGDRIPDRELWSRIGRYDPRPALSGLRCPVLAIYGEQDDATSAGVNGPLMRSLFAASHNPDATVIVFPHGNHGLFETMTGERMEDEMPRLRRFVPGYLDTLTEWLARHTRSASGP